MFLDDINQYKELVLTGVVKLVTGEEFASQDEKEATLYFISKFGFPTIDGDLSSLVDTTDRVEFNNVFIPIFQEALCSKFCGAYGF